MNEQAQSKTATLPQSDVSAGVGLAGLLGLCVWLLFCRTYPLTAEFLGLPGPRQVLSGPYAALAAMVFTAGPMAIWSILVDKVHLRKSTGIDWKLQRSVSDILDVSIVKIGGLWATWAIIGALYCLCRWYWGGQYLFAMKRITWWPQAWLGMVFTWGVLVGWTQLRWDNWDVLAATYAGCVLWVIGYDTIYALQDREDDAMIGVKSSALRLGSQVKTGVALFYAVAIGLWALAFWLYRADLLALLALAPVALHLACKAGKGNGGGVSLTLRGLRGGERKVNVCDRHYRQV